VFEVQSRAETFLDLNCAGIYASQSFYSSSKSMDTLHAPSFANQCLPSTRSCNDRPAFLRLQNMDAFFLFIIQLSLS